mgnify:FL=1
MEILYAALLIYLAMETRRDIRYGEISIKNTAGFIVTALLLRTSMTVMSLIPHTLSARYGMDIGIKSVIFLIGALLPGGVLLLCGRITRQAIGYGDGVLLLICGVYLGGKTAGILFMTGLFFLFPISLCLLISRKAGRKTQVPFAPFLLASYLLWLIQGI